MQPSFPLITQQETASNVNSQYGLTSDLQLAMANSNTQFVLDMARDLKLSYSIPTIAIQIAARFFHLRCYIHYDRFMIILACMILAFKLKQMGCRFRDVAYSFYKIMGYRCNINQPYDEVKHARIKDQICIAENEVLRTLEYDINVCNPHDYLPRIYAQSFPAEPGKQARDSKLQTTTRILILDSNRVQCSLYFTPLTICVSAFMIACRYEGARPYAFLQTKSTDSTINEKSDEELYAEWLEMISLSENEKLKQEQILQCVRRINQVFTLVTV